MKHGEYIMLIPVLSIFFGCRKPYQPPVTTSNLNYLVVEGVINSGHDSTIINLSRTLNVSDPLNNKPETGAQIIVASDHNTTYPLQEIGKGKYASPNLNLNNAYKYRLQITTSNGVQYSSDFESAQTTPPIDSVGFAIQSNDIQLYVNAHDPGNNTRYYRWEYQETWQFNARYQSFLVSNGQQLIFRADSQQVYSCFGNQFSTNIILGSSAKLAKDIIYQSPLTKIESTSERLETKYSILVKQYALTGEAFAFWQNLKKNTEQLGSIFDPQPSELAGNIHCISNPSEPVVGYVSTCTVAQKRIFITKDQLPDMWRVVYPYQCEVDTIGDVSSLIPPGSPIVIVQAQAPNGTSLGYLTTDAECADCTIRGNTKQPAFWK